MVENNNTLSGRPRPSYLDFIDAEDEPTQSAPNAPSYLKYIDGLNPPEPRFFNPPSQQQAENVFDPIESGFDFGQAAADQIQSQGQEDGIDPEVESESQLLDLNRRRDVEDLIFQFPLQQGLIRQLDRSGLTIPAIQTVISAHENERLRKEEEAKAKRDEKARKDIERFTGSPTPEDDVELSPGLSLSPREELAPLEQGETLVSPTDEGQLPGVFDQIDQEPLEDIDLGLRQESPGFINASIDEEPLDVITPEEAEAIRVDSPYSRFFNSFIESASPIYIGGIERPDPNTTGEKVAEVSGAVLGMVTSFIIPMGIATKASKAKKFQSLYNALGKKGKPGQFAAMLAQTGVRNGIGFGIHSQLKAPPSSSIGNRVSLFLDSQISAALFTAAGSISKVVPGKKGSLAEAAALFGIGGVGAESVEDFLIHGGALVAMHYGMAGLNSAQTTAKVRHAIRSHAPELPPSEVMRLSKDIVKALKKNNRSIFSGKEGTVAAEQVGLSLKGDFVKTKRLEDALKRADHETAAILRDFDPRSGSEAFNRAQVAGVSAQLHREAIQALKRGEKTSLKFSPEKDTSNKPSKKKEAKRGKKEIKKEKKSEEEILVGGEKLTDKKMKEEGYPIIDGQPEFARRRGLLDNAGAVGPEKQAKLKTESELASKAQGMFDRQRKEVEGLKNKSASQRLDSIISKWVDITGPIKRRIITSPLGKKVIVYLDNARGASAESLRRYEVAEKDIYKTVPRNMENLFADLLQAHRTIEVEKVQSSRGKKIKSPEGLGSAEMQAYIAKVKETYPKEWPGLEKALNKYWKVSRDLADDLLKEGLITKDAHKFLVENHKRYSPRMFIQHSGQQSVLDAKLGGLLDPISKGIDGSGKKVSVSSSGIDALKEGSERALINNPRLLLGNMISRVQTRIMRNRADKALFEYAKQNPDNPLGIKFPKSETNKSKDLEAAQRRSAPAGFEKITAMIDGKPVTMLMPSELARYWVTSDPRMRSDLAAFISIMSGSATLKPLATGVNPEFMMANLPRDVMHSWFVTKEYSPVLPIAWAQQGRDMLSVFKDVVKRDGLTKKYIQNGGGMNFLTTQGLGGERVPWAKSSRVHEEISQVHKAASYLGESSELLVRVALMKRAMRNGATEAEATWIAKNYIDFAQGGNWAKAADKAAPYLNAGIQGTRGTLRAFKSKEKGGTGSAVATFKAAQIMALASSLAYWNRKLNQEAWESISDRERESKWIITTPFSWTDKDGNKRYYYFGIAKDQGQRVFSTIGEQLVEKAETGEFDWDQLRQAAGDFIPVDQASIFPPTVSALGAYAFNKDFWRNDDVWKGAEVSPPEEWWNITPKQWVVWGEATGLSPERSKMAFNKVVPSYNPYSWLMGATWNSLTGDGVEAFKNMEISEKEELDAKMIASISALPGVRKVLRSTWPDVLTERDKKAAKRLMVETHHKNGKPKAARVVKREIEKSQQGLNDKRIALNRKLEKAMSKGRSEAISFIRSQPDPDEKSRLLSRVKDRRPDLKITKMDVGLFGGKVKKGGKSYGSVKAGGI